MFQLFSRLLKSVKLASIIILASGQTALANEFILHQDKSIALTNLYVIDGTGRSGTENQTLLIQNGKIVSIQDANKTIPAEFTQIDLTGKTVTPGFVMLHEHLFYPTGLGNYSDMVHSFPRLYLAGGTTTIRTAGTMAPYADLNLSKKTKVDKIIGPDIDVTAPYLNGPGLPILKTKALENADDAERMVRYWQSEGAVSYKLYMHIRQDEMKRVIKLAHQHNQKVTGHLCSVTLAEAAKLGIDNLEHGFVSATDFVEGKEKDKCPSSALVRQSLLNLEFDGKEIQQLINTLVQHDVTITSTLPVYETFAKGRPIAYPQALELMDADTKEQYLTAWSNIQASDNEVWTELFKREMYWERKFVEAGGKLVVGTDPTGYGGVVAGWSNIRAIELLIEAGFPLEQAIKIASLNGAKFLERDKEVGSLEVGKVANLAIFDGHLGKEAAAFRKIQWVMKNGIIYNSKALFDSMKGKVGLH